MIELVLVVVVQHTVVVVVQRMAVVVVEQLERPLGSWIQSCLA